MKRFLKPAVLSLAVAATTLSAIPAAEARDRWHHRHHHGDAVAAGVLGLAAGALIAGIASQPTYAEPIYDAPPRYYPEPVYREREVVYVDRVYAAEPWSRDWYRYCRNRYRSFNPETGTFIGYDGREHFCVAN